MAEIDRYRPDDKRGVDALYRRVFGNDAAEANRLRWDWQYRRNPNNPGHEPQIWIAREGPAIIGQYATMPVKVRVRDQEVQGSWGMDVMVAPERQRQGLGRSSLPHVGPQRRRIARARPVGFVLPAVPETPVAGRRPHPVPRQAAHPAGAAPPELAGRDQPARLGRRAAVGSASSPGSRPLRAEVRLIQQFDDSFTALWDELAPQFDFAVRRDAAYLNWKYVLAPHVRYSIAALRRDDRNVGYAVYRHVHEPRGRVTLLVDFLADPADESGLSTLLRWVDREARQADSDKVRAFAMHAEFRRVLRRSGYFQVKSTMEFVAKVNGVDVDPDFYESTDRWHVTLGDSDQDR